VRETHTHSDTQTQEKSERNTHTHSDTQTQEKSERKTHERKHTLINRDKHRIGDARTQRKR